jgi:hypothetical protein
MLDALRALQNEGTRGEVAQGFREQGNEAAKEKRWVDAKEFYTKAIAVLRAKESKWDAPEDEEEERKLLRQVEEASYINRALCHLELSMSVPSLFAIELACEWEKVPYVPVGDVKLIDAQKTTAQAPSTAPPSSN